MCRSTGIDGALQGGLSLSPASYPAIYRNDSVKDNYFGVDVYDPYRWLESASASAIDACATLSPTVAKKL